MIFPPHEAPPESFSPLTAGVTPEKIVSSFRASFIEDYAEFSARKVFGESARERRLADLGFSPDDPGYA